MTTIFNCKKDQRQQQPSQGFWADKHPDVSAKCNAKTTTRRTSQETETRSRCRVSERDIERHRVRVEKGAQDKARANELMRVQESASERSVVDPVCNPYY